MNSMRSAGFREHLIRGKIKMTIIVTMAGMGMRFRDAGYD